MTDIILTNSEANDFLDCKRRWYLGVYRKLGKPDEVRFNTALSIGSMYHECLAAYYGEGINPTEYARTSYANAILKLNEVYDELLVGTLLSDLEKEQDLVITMLDGYIQWLEDEAADEDLEVLGAEEQVRVPLVDGVQLQGKIDATARWRHSPEILLQLEHKTCGGFDDLIRVAQINSQFLTYDLLTYLREKTSGSGNRTDGVIINMARKVKRSARAKPPFFMRYEVRHNEEQLRQHFRHLVSIGREIQRTIERLDAGESHHAVAPPRPTPDCTWKCPYAAPCLSGMLDDGSDFEGYAAFNYVERNPLERYMKVEKVPTKKEDNES